MSAKFITVSVNFFLLSISLPLFWNLDINTHTKQSSLPVLAKKKQQNYQSIRNVTKFKSTFSRKNENLFEKYKKKYESENIKIDLSNLANYNFKIEYSNFNVFKQKHQYIYEKTDNSKPTFIDVGIELLKNIKVKIDLPNQKVATIHFMNDFHNNNFKTMSPSSVSYSIVATGLITNAKITFDQLYSDRGAPKKFYENQYGFFAVNNIRNNVSKFFGSIYGDMVISIIVTCLVAALHGFTYAFQYESSFSPTPQRFFGSVFIDTNSILQNFYSVQIEITAQFLDIAPPFISNHFGRETTNHFIPGNNSYFENYMENGEYNKPFQQKPPGIKGNNDLLNDLKDWFSQNNHNNNTFNRFHFPSI